MPASSLARVVDALRAACSVTVLTGAGVSKASGVPTFRDADGLWNRFRVEDLATPEAFNRHPELVWQWYDWRRRLIAACQPNAAHDVLARWSRRWTDFALVTQNVDGLHERADTAHVIRLHGSIWHLRCWRGCPKGAVPELDQRTPLPSLPPTCPYCGDLRRPAVVWFGETLDATAWQAAERATRCDVFLSVGTSAIVFPAASLVGLAHRQGACTVEINPDATACTDAVSLAVAGPAEVVLPELDRALEG
jgi:NAD-dependent deacetylase